MSPAFPEQFLYQKGTKCNIMNIMIKTKPGFKKSLLLVRENLSTFSALFSYRLDADLLIVSVGKCSIFQVAKTVLETIY